MMTTCRVQIGWLCEPIEACDDAHMFVEAEAANEIILNALDAYDADIAVDYQPQNVSVKPLPVFVDVACHYEMAGDGTCTSCPHNAWRTLRGIAKDDDPRPSEEIIRELRGGE